MKLAKITFELGGFKHTLENLEVTKLVTEDRRFSPEDYAFEFSDGKTDLKLCLNWKKGAELMKEII